MDFTIGRTLGSRELASSKVKSFINESRERRLKHCPAHEAHSTCFGRARPLKETGDLIALLDRSRGLFGVALRHVVTLARAHFQFARLAFGIKRLDAQIELMQPAIVLLVIAKGEPEAVASRQVADNSGESGAIVFNPTDMHSFAT